MIRFFLTIILAFLAPGSVSSQNANVFSEAKGYGVNAAAYDFDKWSFSVGNAIYEIQKSGKGVRKIGKNSVAHFRIKLDKDEELERVVYFKIYKGDLILLAETGSGDYGSGFIARLDRATLQTKWNTDVSGFNIAKGLVENDFAYVAAIGFVGKINLTTGKYIWKHDNLYRQYKESGAFSIFLTPQLKGDLVIFREQGTSNQIEVNKTSGEIAKVLVN